jgi:hypothetical protein
MMAFPASGVCTLFPTKINKQTIDVLHPSCFEGVKPSAVGQLARLLTIDPEGWDLDAKHFGTSQRSHTGIGCHRLGAYRPDFDKELVSQESNGRGRLPTDAYERILICGKTETPFPIIIDPQRHV